MIRYPGSKDKIVRHIRRWFPDHLRLGGIFGSTGNAEYREPFFGAGAVGFRVLETLSCFDAVRINDLDHGIYCLWRAVHEAPDALCRRIRDFRPSTEAFYQYRAEDGRTDLDLVESGFRKLVLHQTSFSGLGAVAGGPIGGRAQSSAYNVDCRWNETRLCADVLTRHRAMRRVACFITREDFGDLIRDAPVTAFIYADPPYVEKGPQLYAHPMSDADHRRLARLLQACRARWVLSYDDHPLVRELYAWARIESVALTYTTAVADGRRRKNSEVVIFPHEMTP